MCPSITDGQIDERSKINIGVMCTFPALEILSMMKNQETESRQIQTSEVWCPPRMQQRDLLLLTKPWMIHEATLLGDRKIHCMPYLYLRSYRLEVTETHRRILSSWSRRWRQLQEIWSIGQISPITRNMSAGVVSRVDSEQH